MSRALLYVNAVSNNPLNISTTAAESLSLYDLQRLVRSTLEARFTEPLWITAEVSELKLNRSGHCYLNLVEKGLSDGAPRAEARAVIWKSAYGRLSTLFRSVVGRELGAGLRLMMRVVVTYHEVYGFSLQIVDIDPSYTVGEVERRRRETIERLKADGVWDMNRELCLVRPTLRLAVVSSPTAAGYQDFMRELGRAPYRFAVTLYESLMQGEQAEESVVAALRRIAECEELFDAVVIIRGGGSTSDLSLFDSYLIATHVTQFPLPIFAGIGHDKDVSIVDMVAHTTCKTPTAVATTLVAMADEEYGILEQLAQQLRDGVSAVVAEQRLAVERLAGDITRSAVVALNNASHRIDSAVQSLAEVSRRLVQDERARLDMVQAVVDGCSVESILRLGFSVVRDSEGRVCSIEALERGQSVEITLAGGVAHAEVSSVEKR